PLAAWQTGATSAAGCSGTSARRSDRPPTLSSARGVMPSDPEKPTRLLLPTVIGHRGAARHAPENTLAGLRKAAELATPWVEFDVMLTADGTAVLHHDETLVRTTGLDRKMAATSYAELASLEAGSWFGAAFAGEPVPTLEEALACLGEQRLGANVEIKPTAGRQRETA